MCGFIGTISLDKKNSKVLERANRYIECRGPDSKVHTEFNFRDVIDSSDNKFFNGNGFFYFVSGISIFFILKIIINRNLNDLILIFIIFCFDPDPWIYHKSFDPIVFCLLITLFKNELFSKLNNKNEKIYSNTILIYYTLIFLMYIFVKPIFLIIVKSLSMLLKLLDASVFSLRHLRFLSNNKIVLSVSSRCENFFDKLY